MPSILENILSVLAQGGQGYLQGKIQKREREYEKEDKKEDEERAFLDQLRVLAAQNQVSPEITTPGPTSPMTLNMMMKGGAPIPGAPRMTPPGGYVPGSQPVQQSPLQRVIGQMKGIDETRPANPLELLKGIAEKRGEQQNTENMMDMERLRQQDPNVRLQYEVAAHTLKQGRHIAKIDPATGEPRLLNVNELADEIATGEFVKREEEIRVERTKIEERHRKRMTEINKSYELSGKNARDLEDLRFQYRKDFEEFKENMQKPDLVWKYGNLDRGVIDQIAELGNVRQTLTLVEGQIEKIKEGFGAGSRIKDTTVRYLGKEGAAKADALMAQLRVALYSVAGKAWTGPELKELRDLVPQRGGWWFGDSDAEMQAKLATIADKLDFAMRNLLTIELSQGKKFDTDSVLQSHGFADRIPDVPRIKILPPPQTMIEQNARQTISPSGNMEDMDDDEFLDNLP